MSRNCRTILTSFLCWFCLHVSAQTNLYIPGNNATLLRWPMTECGSHVYYLSYKADSIDKGLIVISHYFNSVNKYNYTLSRSVLLSRDTSFNVYETIQPGNLVYILNSDTKKFSFFSVTDIDNSMNELSPMLQYPKTISYIQLDTDLNITIPSKPILRFNQLSRYAFGGIGIAENAANNKIILPYEVHDTTSPYNYYFVASKFLILDDTGKLLTNEFLGWEPTGSGTYFPRHQSDGHFCKSPDGTYATKILFFDDSLRANHLFTLFMLDSNLHLIDTLDYPYSDYYGASPTGKQVAGFGGIRENMFFLPTGSLVRSAIGEYKDLTDQKIYDFYGVGKGGRATGYRPSEVYFPPKSDTGDYFHCSNYAYYATMYNGYDNRIYTLTATKSDYNGYLCLNGQSNLGQIAAIDTNMAEKWVKYVRPRPGHCIKTFSVAPADGRKGVLISGHEFSLSGPYIQATWQPFIYYVDSSTRLGINNPESPVIISDQFTVYPNPASDHIVIDNVLGTRFSYSVINGTGQVVLSGTGQGIRTNVAVQDLPPGVYMVVITTADNKSFSLRFLKG